MSLNRLIFYSAMIGGWAAFAGWFLSELLFFQRSFHDGFWGFVIILLAAALVGGCIAGGLTLLGGVANGSFKGQLHRFLPGFLGGVAGGAVGSMLGNAVFLVVPHRLFLLFGWALMGLAIGAVEGIYDKSPKKLRNGLIGGGVGGLLGGMLFTLFGGTSMADRATGFVILGVCIGCFVGLAQVVLKEAWLTVEGGFRPGRQLVLSMSEMVMGTSERAALPFIAFGARGVEPVHARILRRDDGSYVLQDNHSRTGTFVNGQPVQGGVLLRDNDVIQLGINLVRFREVHRHVAEEERVPVRQPFGAAQAPTVAPLGVASGLPPAPPALDPARALPPPAAPAALPRSSPIAPGTPAGQALPPSGIVARPPARPVEPVATPPVSPPVPSMTPSAPVCPICGRPGTLVPQSGKRRCGSCCINF